MIHGREHPEPPAVPRSARDGNRPRLPRHCRAGGRAIDLPALPVRPPDLVGHPRAGVQRPAHTRFDHVSTHFYEYPIFIAIGLGGVNLHTF